MKNNLFTEADVIHHAKCLTMTEGSQWFAAEALPGNNITLPGFVLAPYELHGLRWRRVWPREVRVFFPLNFSYLQASYWLRERGIDSMLSVERWTCRYSSNLASQYGEPWLLGADQNVAIITTRSER